MEGLAKALASTKVYRDEQAREKPVMLTVAEVERRVEQLKLMVNDPEVAHAYEDELYRDVLMEIALGAPEARELAGAALNAHEIAFPRWCA